MMSIVTETDASALCDFGPAPRWRARERTTGRASIAPNGRAAAKSRDELVAWARAESHVTRRKRLLSRRLVQRDRGTNERLERRLVDLLLLVNVDRAPSVALE